MGNRTAYATHHKRLKAMETNFRIQNKIKEILGEFGVDERGFKYAGCQKCAKGNWCRRSPNMSKSLTCLSYRELASTLEKLKIPTKSGKTKWTITQVKRVIEGQSIQN